MDSAPETAERTVADLLRPGMVVRMAVAGALMGLANLVPGVSGGTMVLVMGLYDDFVRSVANLTRLCIRKADILFLAAIASVAAVCIVLLAEPTRQLFNAQRSAMLALFVGLTLGGAPLLYRLSAPMKPGRVVLVILGFGLVAAMAWSRPQESRQDTTTESAEIEAEFVVQPNYVLDGFGGVLGVSAMILPGISGGYMLLLIGRYEMVLGAIGGLKTFAVSGGDRGDLSGLSVLIPCALGAVIGLVVISNLLKWLLRCAPEATSATLLGVLLGSTVGLWPFAPGGNHPLCVILLVVGLAATLGLSRLSAR